MAWIGPAIGAGASLIGGAMGDDPPKYRPFKEAAAQARANNVDRHTPFGSVEYKIDDGGTPDRFRDDTYSMVQSYSPEMQGLLDVMMGIAGRSPSTFQSHMPDGLLDKMSDVYGSEVQKPTYGAPEFAFGYDGSPAQPNTETHVGGEQIAYDAVAGDTTNRELVSQAYQMGDISKQDYNWFNRLFNESKDNFSSADSTAWSSAETAADLIARLDNLTPKNRLRMEEFFSDLYEDGNFRNYDEESMNRLVEAASASA